MLSSTLKFYSTMLPVLGLIFVDGMNIGIQSNTLIHLIPKTDDDLLSGIAIISFGVGSLIGGYVGGKLCDKFTLKRVAVVGVLLYALGCLSILAGSFIDKYPFTLVVFFWNGFEYSYITGC